MSVEGVRDSRAEELLRIRGSHSRDVEVELLQIDPVLLHDLANQSLRLGMMDELRFQHRENLARLLSGHLAMDVARIMWREGAFEHLSRHRNELERSRSGAQDDDVATVQSL